MKLHKKPGEPIVLFGFDDRAFPFQSGVMKHLIPGRGGNVVVPPGSRGSHDEILRLYGTVVHDGDTFKMWYLGSRRPDKPNFSMGRGLGGYAEHCLGYAESHDGRTWTKPELGLVDYGGSMDNNVVDLADRKTTIAAAVIHEPDDPDPSRRFKMAYEADTGKGNRLHVALSADGIVWKAEPTNPVGPFIEMAGITKRDGLYIVNGQDSDNAHHPFRARTMASLVSPDFVHWSPCAAVGMDRADTASRTRDEQEWNNREEIHLGASLWDRGNVLIGVYGQWHGHTTGDRRFVGIDLGLALSYDGISFHEPIPEFKFVQASEQPDSPYETPALVAGQGMTNFGDRTLLWYSLWRGGEGTGVRLAEWERDRLGYVSPFEPDGPRLISAPILFPIGETTSIVANITGTGPNANLRISLLDERFTPIPGYGREETAVIGHDGYEVPVLWNGKDDYTSDGKVTYVALEFDGARPEDIRLHSLYLR